MCKKLPVSNFTWVEDLSIFTESFIKNYDENSDTGYILEVDIEYPKELFNKHKDLPFLPERMKINKCNKLVCKKLCYPYKSSKTSIKSWVSTKKSA